MTRIIVTTIKSTTTPYGKVLQVFSGHGLIFSALDDCFGMDRIRDWAKKSSVVLPESVTPQAA